MMLTGCLTWKKRKREIIERERTMLYSMIFASIVYIGLDRKEHQILWKDINRDYNHRKIIENKS